MILTKTLRDWTKRQATARALSNLSQRQLEDIGAFEARNAEKLRPFISGL
jgi:uncharacterized protein YjiS (DUF1127 family)